MSLPQLKESSISNYAQKQLPLSSFQDVELLDLKDPFFTSQLITYIGNKRRLLPFLFQEFIDIRKRIGKQHLTIFDGFAGSGAVSRLLKYFASHLSVNDFEDYSETINKAYLANRSEVDMVGLNDCLDWLNINKLKSSKSGL